MRDVQSGRSLVPALRAVVSGLGLLACVTCAYQPLTTPGMGSGGGSSGGSSSGSGSGTAPSSGSSSSSGSGDTSSSSSSGTGTGSSGAMGGSSSGTSEGGATSSSSGGASKPVNPNFSYTKIQIHQQFLAESVAVADFNHDGNLDIAAGHRWYAGPFAPGYNVAANVHSYRDGHEDLPTTGAAPEINTGVSDSWAAYSYDIDGDGWDDIIQIAASDIGPMLPGQNPIPFGTGYWFKNPQNKGTGNWLKYQISPDMRGEHKGFVDMTGDGKPEILGSCEHCNPIQTWGYWQADWANPTAPWTFHPVTRTYEYKGGAGWLHGLGAGDINGDGKPDLLERSGIWLQPADATTPWTFINIAMSIPPFLGTQPDIGGSHMFAYDVDGDGLTDVVSSANSHGYGLAWYKQGPPDATTHLPTFTQQMIMNLPQEMAMYNNVAVSQLHSLVLEDMDGDGLKDIVTGKTWLAHPYPTGDAGNMDPVLFYVFQLVRTPTAHFVPHLIDGDTPPGSGSGGAREFKVVDINKDGIKDIVIANKRGLVVFLGKP